jgi:hypothetical protein
MNVLAQILEYGRVDTRNESGGMASFIVIKRPLSLVVIALIDTLKYSELSGIIE